MSRWSPCLLGTVLGLSLVTGGKATPQTTTTTITATIVASSCVGEILTETSAGRTASSPGTVDFGVINPKTRSAPTRTFSLRLSETVGGETGCSAFEAYGRQYPSAMLTFGDIGETQLDEQGVILRHDDGTDARLRVRVTPLNVEGTFITTGGPAYITASNKQVVYPIEFATKGLFDFQASLSQWDGVKSGRFSGALTVTVVYR